MFVWKIRFLVYWLLDKYVTTAYISLEQRCKVYTRDCLTLTILG